MIIQTINDRSNGETLSLAYSKSSEGNVDVLNLRDNGVGAYFIVNSEDEVKEIMSVADDIIHDSGTIDLDINDVKSILHNAHRAYYSSGVGDGNNALKDALEEVKESLAHKGVNIIEAKKLLFRICLPIPKIYNHEYVMEQMKAFMEFQSQLLNDFDLKFCLMPVEGQKTTVSAFVVNI